MKCRTKPLEIAVCPPFSPQYGGQTVNSGRPGRLRTTMPGTWANAPITRCATRAATPMNSRSGFDPGAIPGAIGGLRNAGCRQGRAGLCSASAGVGKHAGMAPPPGSTSSCDRLLTSNGLPWWPQRHTTSGVGYAGRVDGSSDGDPARSADRASAGLPAGAGSHHPSCGGAAGRIHTGTGRAAGKAGASRRRGLGCQVRDSWPRKRSESAQ